MSKAEKIVATSPVRVVGVELFLKCGILTPTLATVNLSYMEDAREMTTDFLQKKNAEMFVS